MMKRSMSPMMGAPIAMVFFTSVSCATDLPSQLFSIGDATIGATTLEQIQDKYGSVKPEKTGKGDEADVFVCYSHSSPKGQSSVLFESGPMGGWSRITAFRISTTPPNKKCVTTKVNVGALATGNGIRIGQTIESFKKAIPVQFKQNGPELTYEAMSKRPATDEEQKRIQGKHATKNRIDFDVTTAIRAKFLNNRLVDLYVHKIESY